MSCGRPQRPQPPCRSSGVSPARSSRRSRYVHGAIAPRPHGRPSGHAHVPVHARGCPCLRLVSEVDPRALNRAETAGSAAFACLPAVLAPLTFVNSPMPPHGIVSNGEGGDAMNVHLQRDFTRLRDEMVEHAVKARGVRSELVLAAMRAVPREAFLPDELREFAYEDAPLPIEGSQTISQPYIVALMTEALALQGGERVLEVGTGSGYAAAVLAQIAGEVYSVERIGQLAEKAASRLAGLGYHNVHVR